MSTVAVQCRNTWLLPFSELCVFCLSHTIRYDTILTCAWKPTWIGPSHWPAVGELQWSPVWQRHGRQGVVYLNVLQANVADDERQRRLGAVNSHVADHVRTTICRVNKRQHQRRNDHVDISIHICDCETSHPELRQFPSWKMYSWSSNPYRWLEKSNGSIGQPIGTLSEKEMF